MIAVVRWERFHLTRMGGCANSTDRLTRMGGCANSTDHLTRKQT